MFSRLILCTFAITAVQKVMAQISGRVTDPVNNPLADAEVRLLSSPLRQEIAQTRTDAAGLFTRNTVPPGDALLGIWLHGFRFKLVNVTIPATGHKEMGTLLLSFLSCDSPDIMCDSFGLSSVDPPSSKRRTITLERNCGVDLEHGKTVCTDPEKHYSKVDFSLISEQDFFYLKPSLNVGLVVNPPPAKTCALSSWDHERFNLTGLGPGIEFCVHTAKGRNAYVYLPERVKPGSQSIKLFYAVYKR